MKNISDRIDSFLENEKEQLHQFRQNGGNVAALFSRQFPLSLLAGVGLWPIRLVEGVDAKAEKWGEEIIRPDACPYCKSLVGNFRYNTPLYKEVDVVVGVITCDQMRRTIEIITTEIELPLFPVQFPATQSDLSKEYYVDSVSEVIQNIEAFLGISFDSERAWQDYYYRSESGSTLKKLFYSATVSPLLLQKLMEAFAVARPKEFYLFLEEILPDIPHTNYADIILITGSFFAPEEEYLLQSLYEKRIYPLPITSTGLNWLESFKLLLKKPDNLVETLSEITFEAPASIRTRPNRTVYQRLERVASKSNASGIIVKTLPFCDLWYTEKERFRESFNIPLLVLETTLGFGGEEQIETRLETFLEML